MTKVGELRLVAKYCFIFRFVVTSYSRQVIFVNTSVLLLTHSFEFLLVVLLIRLSLLMFLDLAVLIDAVLQFVLVFVNAIQGPRWSRHLIFAGYVFITFRVRDIEPMIMLFHERCLALHGRSSAMLVVRDHFNIDADLAERVQARLDYLAYLA